MHTLNPNRMSKKAVFYLVKVRVLSGPKSSLVEDLGQEDRTLLKFYREPSLLMLKNKLFPFKEFSVTPEAVLIICTKMICTILWFPFAVEGNFFSTLLTYLNILIKSKQCSKNK